MSDDKTVCAEIRLGLIPYSKLDYCMCCTYVIQGKDVVAEYAVSAELGEACTCIGEIDSGLRWAAVSEALSDSLERKAAHRKALGEFEGFDTGCCAR